MEKRIHQVFLGEPSANEQRWMESVQRMAGDAEYHLWTEHNVHQLGLEPWMYDHTTAAGASNIIRLHALYKMGGIYCDSDLELLTTLDSLWHLEAFFARDGHGVPCNAVLGAKEGHPWIGYMIDHYGDQRTKDASWGCYLIDEAPKDGVTEIPTEAFYSWDWDTPPEKKIRKAGAIGIHYWQASWTK